MSTALKTTRAQRMNTIRAAVYADALRAADLERINAELVAALEKMLQLGLPEENAANNAAREQLLSRCPEFIGYMKQARAALASAKGGSK